MRVPRHIVEARRERLRTLVRHDGFLPLSEICRRLDISAATARRDLHAIEADGHIQRTYGGALADYNSSFASLGQRAKRSRSSKAAIARAALAQMPDEGTVYLDAGTTVLALARLVGHRPRRGPLTVVTNSLAIAAVLGGREDLSLHLLGGIYLHRQATLFGDSAVAALSGWKIDAAFLGAEGMDAAGIYNSHPEVVRLQQAVLSRSLRNHFCLDASKLGRTTPHRVSPWTKQARLITDASAAALSRAGLALERSQLLLV